MQPGVTPLPLQPLSTKPLQQRLNKLAIQQRWQTPFGFRDIYAQYYEKADQKIQELFFQQTGEILLTGIGDRENSFGLLVYADVWRKFYQEKQIKNPAIERLEQRIMGFVTYKQRTEVFDAIVRDDIFRLLALSNSYRRLSRENRHKLLNQMKSSEKGQNPLVYACTLRNTSMHFLQVLLDMGIDPEEVDDDGKAALFSAVENQHTDLVSFLLLQHTLQHKKIEVDRATKRGETPLAVACLLGCDTIALDLIEVGADPLKGHYGGFPPIVAASMHYASLKAKREEGKWLVVISKMFQAERGRKKAEEIRKAFNDMLFFMQLQPDICASIQKAFEEVRSLFKMLQKDEEQGNPSPSSSLSVSPSSSPCSFYECKVPQGKRV